MALLMQPKQRVLITGSFNPLQTADVKLFEQASKYGDLFVCINKPQTQDILYMIQSMKYVYHAQFSATLESDLNSLKPDILFIHTAQDTDTKRTLAQQRNIQYIPYPNINAPNKNKPIPNSLKDPKYDTLLPWRLCVAGGWLDQPWVSKILPGSVIVMNVDHNPTFHVRSGLATSSRKTAMQLWPDGVFPQNMCNITIAKLLFGAENPPGTKYISGSQDHLGLMLPGISQLHYNGKYWPNRISSIEDTIGNETKYAEICAFIESVLWLVPLGMRPSGFDPLGTQNLSVENIEILTKASDRVWKAMMDCDAHNFGLGLTQTLKAFRLMLPNTVSDDLYKVLMRYANANHGCNFTGSGGGGFLLVIADEKPDKAAFQIKINNESWWKYGNATHKEKKEHYIGEQKWDGKSKDMSMSDLTAVTEKKTVTPM